MGVIQGSILGPLLFIAYINDLPDEIKTNNHDINFNTTIYADDISAFTIARSLQRVTHNCCIISVYFFSYTTSNGITRQESAVLVNDPNSKNDEDQIIRITGYYSYIDNDNNIFLVDYVADENGYNISRKEPSYPAPPVRGYSQSNSEDVYESEQQMGISSAALASLGGS
ncbi:uncharacterized protein LOC123310907 [Coccinella septempunctata]|uniref:uncharacterized protein LOC123310907 n=1 Tax=Coccinella septempunctata TaxID=41139 RepID=UPI001D09230D|nr:uncharacterized protein LOC123310907 [Coccinella septempunctata]